MATKTFKTTHFSPSSFCCCWIRPGSGIRNLGSGVKIPVIMIRDPG
jgi:hypothetical protein